MYPNPTRCNASSRRVISASNRRAATAWRGNSALQGVPVTTNNARTSSTDRANPNAADIANQAINHAASAVEAAAAIAVASTATIPQIGFVHEDSGQSFILDIADLVRHDVTLPIAFGAAKQALQRHDEHLERLVRRHAAEIFNKDKTVAKLIDHIKSLLSPPLAGDISRPERGEVITGKDLDNSRPDTERRKA